MVVLKRIVFIFLSISSAVFAQFEEQKFSLYFEHAAFGLTSAHTQLLDSINTYPFKDELDVHIKGYANSIGDSEYNLELSRKRARSVKAKLRQFTIISSKGYGELNSEAANNRRVDILIHRKVDHIPMEGEIIEPPQVAQITQPTLSGLQQPKKGDKITLQGIMFYEDRDVIMDESREALEALLEFLNRNPNVKFKLIGHICCGDPMKPAKDHKNKRTGKDNLSEARAQAVHNYLAKKGISTRRMRYIGMAFRQSTGKGDRFDRRVEIEITSVD